MTEFDRQSLLQTLLQELTAAMRLRSEPEHLYTAASVAGFGAVAWESPSLQISFPATQTNGSVWPLWTAAIGVFFSAAIVIYKIIREHKSYERFQAARSNVTKRLSELPGAEGLVPKIMLSETSGNGYLYSILLVAISAIGAIGFCAARVLS